jgi:hypothetical protein
MIALVAVSLPLAACSKKREVPQPAALPTEGAPKAALAAVAPGAVADPLPNAPTLPADQVVEAKLGDAVVLLPRRPKGEVAADESSIHVTGLFSEPIEITKMDQFYATKEAALADEGTKLALEVSLFDGPGRYSSISAKDNGWRFVVSTVAIDDESMLSCSFNAAVSADEAKQVLDFCKAVGVKRAARATGSVSKTPFELKGAKVQLPLTVGVTAEKSKDGGLEVHGLARTSVSVYVADWVIEDKSGGEETFSTNHVVHGEMLRPGSYALVDQLGDSEFKGAVTLKVDASHSVVCEGERLASLAAAERVVAFCEGVELAK